MPSKTPPSRPGPELGPERLAGRDDRVARPDAARVRVHLDGRRRGRRGRSPRRAACASPTSTRSSIPASSPSTSTTGPLTRRTRPALIATASPARRPSSAIARSTSAGQRVVDGRAARARRRHRRHPAGRPRAPRPARAATRSLGRGGRAAPRSGDRSRSCSDASRGAPPELVDQPALRPRAAARARAGVAAARRRTRLLRAPPAHRRAGPARRARCAFACASASRRSHGLVDLCARRSRLGLRLGPQRRSQRLEVHSGSTAQSTSRRASGSGERAARLGGQQHEADVAAELVPRSGGRRPGRRASRTSTPASA